MAKRIIQNGKYNVVTCTDCGCVFAFDKVDIEVDADGKSIIVCSQCDAVNTPTEKK